MSAPGVVTQSPRAARVDTGIDAGRRTWRPGRDDVVDAGAVAVLALLASVGFTSVFDGHLALALGAWAAVLGALVGLAVGLRRLSPLAGLAVVVAGFVLGSGPAIPNSSLAGFLPGPDTVPALWTGLVKGWSRLLTTSPPVGFEAGMGVVPYVCVYFPVVAAMIVALRSGAALLPAVPLLGAVGASIAFGTSEPASVLAQGVAFAVVTLVWAAVRANRERRSVEGGIYWPRVLSGAAMLGIVGLAGAGLSSGLPFVDTAERAVLRSETEPPFNPESHPSPLAGFRMFTGAEGLKTTFFTVSGVRNARARVRLATMDTYNGVVWIVTGQGGGSGRFERVGRRILPVPDGASERIGVEVGDYEGVWVPSVGTTRSVTFSADEDLQADFRYNRTTGTGAMPGALRTGDRYTLDARVPVVPSAEELAQAKADTSVVLPPLPADPASAQLLKAIRERALDNTAGATSHYGQAEALVNWLKQGGYSPADGTDPSSAGDGETVPAGHGLAYMAHFVEAERPNGNGEQYASALALMARQLGMPARVVIGFKPGDTGTVALTGAHVQAWVEIALQTDDWSGWVPFDPTPDKNNRTETDPDTTKKKKELSQQAVPPPTYLDPPEELVELAGQQQKKTRPEDADKVAGGLPRPLLLAIQYAGPPLLVVLAIVTAIVGLKSLRRRRRRTSGSPVNRINGAWLEAVDRLRDLGLRPVPAATRSELLLTVPDGQWAGGPGFAATVDEAMFGPAEPDPTTVAAIWADLDQEVRAIRKPLTRRQRIRSSLSLASLRPRR